MNKYGGSFVVSLVKSFHHADESNKRRLVNAFEHYFKEYGALDEDHSYITKDSERYVFTRIHRIESFNIVKELKSYAIERLKVVKQSRVNSSIISGYRKAVEDFSIVCDVILNPPNN